MNLVDQLLNLASVLIWLNWRSMGLIRPNDTPALTLLGTIKRTEPHRTARWTYLAGLLSLLVLRSVFYWHVGSDVGWVPILDLCAISLPFRSDYFLFMLLYSGLSFGLWLAGFYAWLLLISVINRKVKDTDAIQKLVRLHLGFFESWPALLKFFLPMVTTIFLWVLISPAFVRLGLMPAASSAGHRWQQAAVLGGTSLLAWKYLLLAVLCLYVLNSYVYLGQFAFLTFVNLTARNLLRPLHWIPLRWGKADATPLFAIGLVLASVEAGYYWLPRLYQKLPL